MSRIDVWTERTVDYAIALLVQAERVVRDIEPDLYEKIRRFLLEEA
jgi:hypothetical protein